MGSAIEDVSLLFIRLGLYQGIVVETDENSCFAHLGGVYFLHYVRIIKKYC